MVTYYIIKLDVSGNQYSYDEAFALFTESAEEVEQEAKDRAQSLLRPSGTQVIWSYYGPFEMADDRIMDSCNFGVI